MLVLAGVGSGLRGDEPQKAETKPGPAPKGARQPPAGWAMLNLSDAQRKRMHAVPDEYGPQIAALRKQLEGLPVQERAKMYDLLTAEQEKQLKDLRGLRDSGADDKKADKKDEKKP